MRVPKFLTWQDWPNLQDWSNLKLPKLVLMRKSFLIFSFILAVMTGAIARAPHTLAQDAAPQTVVLDSETSEGRGRVLANVYFTLQDEAGRPFPDAEIQSAAVLLEDGRQFPATIEKPPYYVALVIDASGSMSAVLPNVQETAVNLVNAAPPDTNFAVIRFDETISLVQPFTNDKAQLLAAINAITVADNGTCLYNVAYTAMQALEDVSGNSPRGAMVIFTDGRDEVQRGQNRPCSAYTYDQLVAYAASRTVDIPIHTIGVAARPDLVNTAALEKLSASTGGIAATGNPDELNELIKTVVATVSSQWLAQAELKPGPGFQRATLLLTLADGQKPLGGSFGFYAGQDYRERVGVTAVDIGNFRYDAQADRFQFDVALTNLPNVGSLQIETLDEQDNVQVDLRNIQSPSSVQGITLQTNALQPGERYVVKVTPRQKTGEVVRLESGAPLTAEYHFQYDPPLPLRLILIGVQVADEPARINLRSLRLEDDAATLRLQVQLQNAAGVTGLNGRLIDRATHLEVDSFPLEVDSTGTAVVPLRIPGGNYTLVAEALDENNAPLTTAQYDFSYAQPDNQWVQTGKAVRSNPLLIFLLIALLVFGLASGWRGGLGIGRRQGRRILIPGLNMGSMTSQPVVNPLVDGVPEPVILTLISSPDTAVAHVGQWEITRFPFTIGRENADLTIANDRHISRQHARLTFEGNDYFLEDLGSSNGTFVNETKIAAREPVPLRTDRDSRIQIGRTTIFTFHVVPPETLPEPNGAAVAPTAVGQNGVAR